VVEQEHPKVLDALEIIDSALSLPGFSPKNASDIANELKISQTHLDRLMIQETGLTLYQQIEARRFQKAQDALIANESSLKVIAYDLGFSSPSHFISWFKQRQGITPLQYRKRKE